VEHINVYANFSSFNDLNLNMKTRLYSGIFPLLVLVCLFFNGHNLVYGQISHGGLPLFYTPSALKSSADDNLFIEMPAFNVDSLLKEDELNKSNMRTSFRFANKFFVNIEKGKTGRNVVLPDGTKVWQIGIRSKGAYSINVFFSKYNVPEGGRLFLYNSGKSHIIGSFTNENNSEDQILPIQPVAGDEIIVEYIEPANVAFEGELKISEVNHDYRDLLNYEPQADPAGSTHACMPDILCEDPDNDNMRSAVLLTLDGIYACSGSLLNTTNNDGEPVLLTAVHCLNSSFNNPDADYIKVAGTIVCFFNYRKPVCSLRMKGSAQMSLAGATPLSIAIKNDMALLRLKEIPPDYYNPYYAGWNVNPDAGNNNPFINIHYPEASVAKYGTTTAKLTIVTFPNAPFFNSQSHWQVSSWDVGATAPGSSGSPPFDNQGLVIGGLSGGLSTCSNSLSDYFFALYKSWEYVPDIGIPLKDCLDPANTGELQWVGNDPYKYNPVIRLKNTDYNGTDTITNSTLSSPLSGFVFGHNSIGTQEFAEEYTTNQNAEIAGAFLIVPGVQFNYVSSPINIKVYKDSLSEDNIIASKIFYPTFLDFDTASVNFVQKPVTMTLPTETFVKFSPEVPAGKKFYVSYEVTYPSTRNFSVYNVTFGTPKANTAWLRDADGNWFPATQHPDAPMSTSLAIEPLVRYVSDTTNNISLQKKENDIIYLPESRQLYINTNHPNETGVIAIYSITGKLLDKVFYTGNNPVFLQSIPRGNIVIVKAISESGVKAGKIVL